MGRLLSALSAPAAAFCAAFLAATAADAESLADRRAGPGAPKPAEIDVACGPVDKTSCVIVLPMINAQTAGQDFRLRPLESVGSVDSIDGLCQGLASAALVEANTLAARATSKSCPRELLVLSPPLYAREAYVVVRADTGPDDFGALIAGLAPGAFLRIAAGGGGANDDFTLRSILAETPEWKARVEVYPDASETALDKLRTRQIEAVFIMDGPLSPLVTAIRNAVDPKTREPAFKLLSLVPASRLLTLKFQNLRAYAQTTIDTGWFSAVKTVASPSVLAVTRDFYVAQPEMVSRLAQAAQQAAPMIAKRLGASSDWRQQFDRRQ